MRLDGDLGVALADEHLRAALHVAGGLEHRDERRREDRRQRRHRGAWAALNSDVSRPFLRPASGRIAVKVINPLGDEAMKVFRV